MKQKQAKTANAAPAHIVSCAHKVEQAGAAACPREGGTFMDPFDTEAVRAVWARVSATQEQRLSAMIAGELHDRDCYLLLSRRYPRWKKLFYTLATEEARHARRLSSLYYLLFGCEAKVAVEKPKSYSELCEALRDRYARELSSVQSYESAAAHFSSQRELFAELEAEERRHARQIQELAQAVVCKQMPRGKG